MGAFKTNSLQSVEPLPSQRVCLRKNFKNFTTNIRGGGRKRLSGSTYRQKVARFFKKKTFEIPMRGVCNQTWLNPSIEDGCKDDYITKLGGKKKGKKKALHGRVGKGMMLGQKLFTMY